MKSNSFSKKLLSAFLAALMAFSCLSGVMSANAASADTDTTLYDDKLAYNFLGWVDTTDDQVLDALLDFADEMLAKTLGTAKDSMNISVAVLNYDLTSVNGLLSTIESLRKDVLLSGIVDSATGGTLNDLNLGGQRRNYYVTGGGSGFTESTPVMTRENSSSKEIIRGIFNILYMNSNTIAYHQHNSSTSGVNEGGNVVQQVLNGQLSIGGLEGLIVDIVKGQVPTLVPTENTVYGIIGGLLHLPVGYEADFVNNLVVFLMKQLVADKYADQGMINTINTKGSTYYFEDAAGNRLSFEQWAIDAVNKCVLDTLVGVDGEHIFKDSGFTMSVEDNAYDDVYGAFVPVFKHTLLPLFSTISLDFNFVTHFTKMYYGYLHNLYDVKDDKGDVISTAIDASTPDKLASYWTADKIDAWINADYVEIGKYIGAIQTPESTNENRIYQFPGMATFDENNEVTGLQTGIDAADVKAAMVELFESLDRHSDSIDPTQLFSSLLYSPVAEALGIETGVLNLNLKDYYLTGNNIKNFFNFNVFTENGSIKSDGYALVVEMLSFLFPKFDGWTTPSRSLDINVIVNELITSAGSLIKYVGDSVCPAIFAGYDVINETNIEQAILPFIRAILSEVDITKQIHEEEWEKCDDLEDMLYVALTEYLKYSLPQYDYSKLVTVENGHYTATIEKMLPMARDALAYVMQTSVPLTTDGSDSAEKRWDVFVNGGTDENGNLKDSSFTAYDMLNALVVYYATESQIAPLLNVTEYTVNGTAGIAGSESAITMKNSIWKNIDIIAETLFPLLADWLGVDKIDSEKLVMGTLVNGFLNISEPNTTIYGHNKQGISAILYNVIYMFTDSSIMQRQAIPVVYEFVKNLLDVLLGARNNKDAFGFEGILPVNTGLQPITDLLSSRILSGGSKTPSGSCQFAEYANDGLVGMLIGRIAECAGAGELSTKPRLGYVQPDTVLPAGAKIIKMANDMANFMPILSDHTFKAPEVKSTSNVVEGYWGEELSGLENRPYIEVKNAANGLNAAIFRNGSDTPSQLSRYFIKVNGIEVVGESAKVHTDTRYQRVTGKVITYSPDPNKQTDLIAPNESAYYAIDGMIENYDAPVTLKLTYDIVDKNRETIADYTNLTTTGQFLVTSEMSTENSQITFNPKPAADETLAAKIKAEVSDDRANLDETNFDIFTYRLMVKAAQKAEKLVYGTYDKDFVVDSSSDPAFEAVKTYEFYAASDVNHENMIANTTLALFQGDVEAGKYVAQGIAPGAVEGTDYVLGHWVPSKSSLDKDGNIIYKYVTDADSATVNEAIRVYNLYKAQVMHRGYIDNDRALLQEMLCATGDAYNYNYKINDLKTYVGNAFTANYVANGVSTVTFTAKNTNADPTYGVLENGQLVNNDPEAKYTEESWTEYINALAAAVEFIKTASTDRGYREGIYNSTFNYEHEVVDISNVRTALMKAENNLEIEGQGPVTGSVVTGIVMAMVDPTNPDSTVGSNPVADVDVIVNGEIVATTDAEGKYSITLPDGQIEVTFRYAYGPDRTVTVNVNGAAVDAGVITIVTADMDNNGNMTYVDTGLYQQALMSADMMGDINKDGSVSYVDTGIYQAFLMSGLDGIYTAKTIG